MRSSNNTSKNKLQREGVWLGFVDKDGSPILYPLRKLSSHMWLTGSTEPRYRLWFVDRKADSLEVLKELRELVDKTGKQQRRNR